jgi:hypothetical protein
MSGRIIPHWAGFVMSVMQAKVPAVVATGIICLLVGGGLGAAIMSYSAGKPEQAQASPGDENAKGGPPDAKGMGGPPGAKGDGKKGGGKGGKGGKGPNPQAQLGQLIGKVDTLTKETLHVELTPDQKKQIKEQLAGLDEKDMITEDEAKDKLDKLLAILAGHRKTIEAAGFVWPGPAQAPAPKEVGMPPKGGIPPGGPPIPAPAPTPPQNPFKAGPNADHLKSFRSTLG